MNTKISIVKFKNIYRYIYSLQIFSLFFIVLSELWCGITANYLSRQTLQITFIPYISSDVEFHQCALQRDGRAESILRSPCHITVPPSSSFLHQHPLHCMLGMSNLYVSKGVNVHSVHCADIIGIPLLGRLPPINQCKHFTIITAFCKSRKCTLHKIIHEMVSSASSSSSSTQTKA